VSTVTSEPSARARVVLVQTTIPDYRTAFFRALSEAVGPGFVLVSGEEDFALDLRHAGGLPYVAARNHFLARRRLLWQSGIFGYVLRAQVAVLVLNPRILSNWVALALRRIRGKRTVLWGHAWSRTGQSGRRDRLRGLMRRLADTVIVYTETQARELRERSPHADVVAAPNALFSVDELERGAEGAVVRDFVYVGRLSEEKKPALLLEAFERARPALPEDVRLVIVGDGPLRARLEQRVLGAGLHERVAFLGHVAGAEELRRIYDQALASVSPGYLGLSLIQSLWFGVPMIAARDEPHSPEIEAAVEGENTVFFASDSPDDLASALESFAEDRAGWLSRRPAIASEARARYSVERMVDAYVAALRRDEADRDQPSN
jgi:glycosyltransferase involved in cell wall biosynthesis